jgi:hypothetical protein
MKTSVFALSVRNVEEKSFMTMTIGRGIPTQTARSQCYKTLFVRNLRIFVIS